MATEPKGRPRALAEEKKKVFQQLLASACVSTVHVQIYMCVYTYTELSMRMGKHVHVHINVHVRVLLRCTCTSAVYTCTRTVSMHTFDILSTNNVHVHNNPLLLQSYQLHQSVHSGVEEQATQWYHPNNCYEKQASPPHPSAQY